MLKAVGRVSPVGGLHRVCGSRVSECSVLRDLVFGMPSAAFEVLVRCLKPVNAAIAGTTTEARRRETRNHLAAAHRNCTLGNEDVVTFGGVVVVVTVKGPAWEIRVRGKRVEFIERTVTDEVSPEPPMGGPTSRIDEHCHLFRIRVRKLRHRSRTRSSHQYRQPYLDGCCIERDDDDDDDRRCSTHHQVRTA